MAESDQLPRSRWLNDIQGYIEIVDSNDEPVRRRHKLKIVGAAVSDDGSKTVLTITGSEPVESTQIVITGPQGEPGERGDTGQAGIDGRDGRDGAQGSQGNDGAPGEQGMPGQPGERGERGEKGDKGDQGEPGQPGSEGASGATGERGERGEKGDKGDQGEPGQPGADGAAGRDGVDGSGGGSIAERRIMGRADGAGSGPATALQGFEVGQIIRYATEVLDTTSTGSVVSYAGVTDEASQLAFSGVTLTLHSILAPAESGQLLVIRHIGAGSTTLVQGSTTEATAARRFALGAFATNSTPIVLTDGMQETFIHYGARWRRLITAIGDGQVTNAKMTNVNPGTQKGLQIDAGGAATPVDLTGLEQGENLRIDTVIVDSSGGTLTDAVVPVPNNCLEFQNCTAILNSIVGVSGRIIVVRHTGTGSTTIVHEHSGSAVANQITVPGEHKIKLENREQLVLQHFNGRWRVISLANAPHSVDYVDTGTFNDLDIIAIGVTHGDIFRIETTGAMTINGFLSTSIQEGFEFTLTYRTANHGITFNDESVANVNASSRIRTPYHVPLTLQQDESVRFRFESSRWRAVGTSKINPFSGQLDHTTVAGTTNNLAIGDAHFIRLNISGGTTLTGIVPAYPGQMIILYNANNTGTVTLVHDNAGSTAANRFALPSNVTILDYPMLPMTGVILKYDNTLSRWTLVDIKHQGLTIGVSPTFSLDRNQLEFIAGSGIGLVTGTSGKQFQLTIAIDPAAAINWTERASSPTVGAGNGLWWFLNETPNQAMWTDDLENDWRVGYALVTPPLTANAQAVAVTTNLSFGTFTIPAGTLRVGSTYRISGFAAFLHAAAATPTLTIEFLINGAVVETLVVTPAATAATYSAEFEAVMVCRTTGAGGTCFVRIRCMTSAGTNITNQLAGTTGTATDAIDTTVARSIEMRVRMTTAVGGNTLTLTEGKIERLR